MLQPINDADDPRLADYRALTDVALRTRFEPPHGLFIAEGELVLRRALRAGFRPRSVLIDVKRVDQLADLDPRGLGGDPSGLGGDPSGLSGDPSGLGGDLGDVPVYTAEPPLLELVTGFHVHRGVLASFHRRPLPEAAEVLAGARRVAILEDINNHTNIGAIFRGAAALGMDAVLLSPSCADPLYRRSVRVSMGEVFAVPYARLGAWPAGLAEIREAGFTLLALTPGPQAVAIGDLTAVQRERPALLLGSEGSGLSAGAMAAADVRVVIPMRRGVDSLNVAAAAAVAFFELSR